MGFEHEADVCIIGGGPAGSTLAIRLAQLGHRVCLVERATFPRRHLGESLSPGVLPLLETIGARRAVEEAGFRRVRSVQVTWDQGPTERQDSAQQGLLVDRGPFDQLLLERARAAGVRVLQPAVVRERHLEESGWRLRVDAAARAARRPSRRVPGRREREVGQPVRAHAVCGRPHPGPLRLLGGECASRGAANRSGSRGVVLGGAPAGRHVQHARLRGSRTVSELARDPADGSVPGTDRPIRPARRRPQPATRGPDPRRRSDAVPRARVHHPAEHQDRRRRARHRPPLLERGPEGDPDRPQRRGRREHLAPPARVS